MILRCNNCKHNAMVPVTSLLNHYGDNITSDEVLRGARFTKGGFQGDSQMRLVFVGKSSFAQTATAVNTYSIKDVKKYLVVSAGLVSHSYLGKMQKKVRSIFIV